MTPRVNATIDTDEVPWIAGRTRLYGIVGHPIQQVRSPEMFSAEFIRRGRDAVMIPIHVLPSNFMPAMHALMLLENLDGLIFTIPYKQAACALASTLDPQAQAVGAINALARGPDGRWAGGMFDGAGCVAAFQKRGLLFRGRHVTLIGAGGAGSAIGAAVAAEGPAAMRLFDPDANRAQAMADTIRRIDPAITIEIGAPDAFATDILLNASPVGMLGDPNTPIPLDRPLPAALIVFDAIVKPDQTALLLAAAAHGCTTVRGREMMRGQITRIADFFEATTQRICP